MSSFCIKQVSSGVKFDLVDDRGIIIVKSEVYISEGSCLKGIESVRRNAVKAHLEDCTDESRRTSQNPKFMLYADKKGEFRFRLKARNGEIIAVSEGYKAKASCKNGIESVRRNATHAVACRETSDE